MNTFSNHSENPMPSPNYEICIKGRLDRQGQIWFEGMTLIVNEETTPPQTTLLGYVPDQSALYGLISRIRDLGLTLLSVKQINREEEK